MKNISFLISGYLLCLNLAAQSYGVVNKEVFVTDKTIEAIAQKFDSIYFPLFVSSFTWIQNEDTAKIREHFNNEVLLYHDKKTINLADSANLHIQINYKFKNYAVEDYPLNPPIVWTDEIHPDPSWRLWFQSLVWLEPYLKSCNSDSVNAAFFVINDWMTSHLTYPVRNEKFAFDDHAIAERLMVLVQAYRIYENSPISDTRFKHRLLLTILNHIYFVASLEKYSCWHNHAIIFDERLIAALGILPEFNMQYQFLEFAFQRVFEQYRYSFSCEGIHKEHSPCYHIGFTEKLNEVILAAKQQGIYIPENILEIQAKANLYVKTIQLFGDNIAIGDCYRSQLIKDSQENEEDYPTQTNDSVIAKVNKKNLTTENSILFHQIIYPATGWVFLNNKHQELNFIAQSDFFGFSHYQQDETSFILNKSGYELIIDPGLYSYAKSPVYDFYRSAHAHNILIVDDRDFDIDYNNTGLSGITRFFPEELNGMTEGNIFEMTHPHYRNRGIEIYRQYILPAINVLIIKDIISSNDQHTYKQLFHLAPGAKVEKRIMNM